MASGSNFPVVESAATLRRMVANSGQVAYGHPVDRPLAASARSNFRQLQCSPEALQQSEVREPHGPRHWKSAQPAGESPSLMIVYTREGTYDHITSAIRLVGGEVDGAAVIYDGSPIRRQEVKSLYRYYCDGLCGSYHSSRRGGSRLLSAEWRGSAVQWVQGDPPWVPTTWAVLFGLVRNDAFLIGGEPWKSPK